MNVFSCVVGCLLLDYSLGYVENVKLNIILCLFLFLLLMSMGTHLKTILTNKQTTPPSSKTIAQVGTPFCFFYYNSFVFSGLTFKILNYVS